MNCEIKGNWLTKEDKRYNLSHFLAYEMGLMSVRVWWMANNPSTYFTIDCSSQEEVKELFDLLDKYFLINTSYNV